MIIFTVGMAAGRLRLGGWSVVVGALAGCGPQPLVPTSDAGASPATVSQPPPGMPTGDGGTPPATVGAATDAGPVFRLARTTLLTSADLTTAKVLAADADGIYWVTGDNQLWMLPAGSDAPGQLAADPNPMRDANYNAALLATRNALFWTASILAPNGQSLRSPLHRTQKTGGDVVLANCPCRPPELAADDAHLYFPQGSVADETAMIAALPLDADPGTAPTPLVRLGFDGVLSSVAVDDQYVYWTTYPVASTVQIGEGPVTRGDKASLLAGDGIFSELVADWVSALRPVGGALYVVYAPPWLDWFVGRVDQTGARSNLPLPGGSTLLVLDRWVVTATTPDSTYPRGRMIAAPARAVAGDGSLAVQIADDVMVLPVIGPPGLVFVDSRGHLWAMSAPDLGTAVAAGQP